MPYALLKEKGLTPDTLAEAKKLVLAKAATSAEHANLPCVVVGLSKKAGAQEIFWFTTAATGTEGLALAADAVVGFYAYLIKRHIKVEALRGFDITTTVLSDEEAGRSTDLIAKLKELSDDEKYANFVEFIGKRDLTPRYKSRGR